MWIPNRVGLAAASLLFSLSTTVWASLVSDGSDGPFSPGPGTVVIDLTLPGREDGVLNFTTINIPSTTTVTFKRNAQNTPVFMAAQGDVTILGAINISSSGGRAGPGGGEGGIGGFGDPNCTAPECRVATNGGGVLGGNAGQNAVPGGIKSTPGYAGSGGGMATPGLAADPNRFSASADATGFLDKLPEPFAGGSGGGGGGGWMFFGVELGGGDGGDGGGALQISTPGNITLGGALLANGANGVWGFTNVGGTGGPGGGGSGGNFELAGNAIDVLDTAVVQAIGGWGGCLSTEKCDLDRPSFSKLNNGGLGFFDLTGRTVQISSAADIQAVTAIHVVPIPPAAGMLSAAFAILAMMRQKVPKHSANCRDEEGQFGSNKTSLSNRQSAASAF